MYVDASDRPQEEIVPMPYRHGLSPTSRLLIVSNRLPVTINSNADGDICVERSSGGLATALARTHADHNSLWIGWPGGHFRSASIRKHIEQTLRTQHQCVPVFLRAREIQRYYNGFSNLALWPLFHSFQTLYLFHEVDQSAVICVEVGADIRMYA